MYRCESWTIRRLGTKEIYAFELWCWRRLLRVPWTARRSNQSILKEINLEYSLKWLMLKLKLKLQYFGYLMQRANSLENTLMLGKIEGKRRRGWQRIRLLDGITNSMEEFEQTPRDSEGQEAWCDAVHGVPRSWMWLSNWTTTTWRKNHGKKIPFLFTDVS